MITRESIPYNPITTVDVRSCDSAGNSLQASTSGSPPANSTGQTNAWDLSCNATTRQQPEPEAESETDPAQPVAILDRRARKKDQNRRAASNYRRKKMEEKNRMREEEMRLVYSRVCLIGYAEELEGSIMYILNTKTMKIFDKCGNAVCFLCPICLKSCDNLMNLRSHLNANHYAETYLKHDGDVDNHCNSK